MKATGRRLIGVARRLYVEEGGWNLMELLVAMTMMVVVLGAALLTFEVLLTNQGNATTRFDAQDRARTALDRLARDLRNISGASTGATEIDQAGAYDLIFRTVNAVGPATGSNPTNIQRVRFCVDNSNPANEVLWFQAQSITQNPNFTAPSGCPATGFAPLTGCSLASNPCSEVYADSISNQNGGQTRPVFSYTTTNGAITFVHNDLFVLAQPSRGVPESHISSGVFLRNQDVPPTAAFSAVGGAGYATLDGSASSDPQGSPLTYSWFDTMTCSDGVTRTIRIGEGIVFSYIKDACTGQRGVSRSTPTNTHQISLKVFDPAGVEGDAPSQTVTVQ